MVLFLGYDPGGAGKHGVAKADIGPNGAFLVEPVVMTLADAGAVRDWLRENDSAKALGIDTLLAWSISGGRACDDALRAHYPERAPTVIPQNSLYSAMTINGILVAQTGRELGIPLVESHPKLLLRAALEKDPEGAELAVRHRAMLEAESGKAARAKADDRADALVAAWCASRWWFNRWPNDLYTAIPDDLTFPAGPAVYPWLEPIGST
jgi:predicted nuclease with RNAse H fold